MPIGSHRSLRCLIPAVLICSALGGCASNGDVDLIGWTGLMGKPERVNAPIPHDAYAKLGYQLSWTGFAAVQEGHSVDGFDIHDGLLVVRDTHGAFSAMSPVSGDLKWARLVGEGLTTFVGTAKADRVLHIFSASEVFFQNADTGEPVLDRLTDVPIRQRMARVASTHPIHTGAVYVFGCDSGHATSHVTSVGISAWSYLVGGAISCDPVLTRSGNVAFATESGNVLLLDPGNGLAAGRANLFGGVSCPPAVGPDRFFVACKDQSVYAMDDHTCQILWRFRTDSALTRRPTYDSGRVYVDVPSTGLIALDATTGGRVWEAKGVSGEILTKRKNRLLVWNGQEAVTVDATNGGVIERATIEGLLELRSDKAENGNLYAVWASGQVSKFVAR